MTHPDLFLERQERGTARVMRDPFETKIVELLTDYCKRQMFFTSDELGDVLDKMGVARECNLRKRLTCTTVNAGKGKWWNPCKELPYIVSRRHGGPRRNWEVVR